MASSRMARMGMALALLALMLAAAPVDHAQAVKYRVGGLESNPNWFPEADASFYQKWAENVTLYVNDSLWFLFDNKIHDVTQLWSASDLTSCSIANRGNPFNGSGDFTLILPFAGTVYLISSGQTSTDTSADCLDGMQFFVRVLSSPAPSPAPSPSPSPSPPPVQKAPAPGEGSSNTSTDQGKKGKTFPVAAVAVSTVVISIVVLAFVGFRYYRRQYGSKPRGRYSERHVVTSRRFGNSGQARSPAINGMLKGSAARLTTGTFFTYAELDRATSSFSADNEVGRGGFGTVYKGTLDDGRTVAIKMGKHAEDVESFVNEVDILSQVNHRNLVKLLGCCIEGEIPLLVFEFVPNGTLQDGLGTGLDWKTRFRIALQTAEALKYLHVQATPPIIHRDVKSANILLDHALNGKVADFGLSKLVALEDTHVFTLVKGTPGYLDPEYYRNCKLTDKTDVYSFGVVLLELITSKKPMDYSKPEEEPNLALSSIPLIKSGRVHEIVDSHMLSTLSAEELHAVGAVAQVAAACVGSSRTSRPSMSEVVEMLQAIKGSKLLKAEEFYSKADVIDCEDRMIEMQGYGILLGDSGSTTRGTSSSDSGNVTQPMRLR